jgi:hypothetical protein
MFEDFTDAALIDAMVKQHGMSRPRLRGGLH